MCAVKSAASVGRVGDHLRMQLAPVASLTPVIAPAMIAPSASVGMLAVPFSLTSAAPTAPALVVDFPGISAGQQFDVVKGSKAGFFGVRGESTVLRMDPDAASFHVKAGALGMQVDVTIDIAKVDATTVRLSSTGVGFPNMSELGRIVESRTDFAVFEQVSDPSKLTKIVHDGHGNVTIDTVVPTLGNVHLVLDRRSDRRRGKPASII